MASLGYNLSGALKFGSDQWTSRCAAIARDVLSKFRHRSVPERQGNGICDECSRSIRFWESRIFVTDRGTVHRSCWDSKQFFIEFVHQQSHELTPALHAHELVPAFYGAVRLIESTVYSLREAIRRGGEDTPQSEYMRGVLYGAKSMLTELKGRSNKELVLAEVYRRTGGPLPSTLPLADDGNRYGWDGSDL